MNNKKSSFTVSVSQLIKRYRVVSVEQLVSEAFASKIITDPAHTAYLVNLLNTEASAQSPLWKVFVAHDGTTYVELLKHA